MIQPSSFNSLVDLVATDTFVFCSSFCYNSHDSIASLQLVIVIITRVCVPLMRQCMNRVVALVEVSVLSVYIIQLEGAVKCVLPTTILGKEYPSLTQWLVLVSYQLQVMHEHFTPHYVRSLLLVHAL